MSDIRSSSDSVKRPSTEDRRVRRTASEGSGAVRRPVRPADGVQSPRRASAEGASRVRPAGAEGRVRRPAPEGAERVRRSADGAERVRRPAEGAERVRRTADGAERVRRPVEGAERVRRTAESTERVRRSAEGAERPRRTAEADRRVRRSAEGTERPRRSAAGDLSRRSIDTDSHTRRSSLEEANPRVKGSRARYNTDKKAGLRPNDNRRPKAKQPEKKRPIFWIGLGIYAGVLVLLGLIFLGYTTRSLKKYEASQPDNYMEAACVDFKKMVEDGSIVDKIQLPSAVSALESPDIFKNMYLEQFAGKNSYTFEKDKKSYDAKAPIYNIKADGQDVAKIKLKSSNERRVFAILELCDWTVDEVQPVFIDKNITTYSYSINVPMEYRVTVNGNELTSEYLTGNSTTNPDFVNVVEYVEMPSTVEYKITGLINPPVIKIYDAAGQEVNYTPDAKGNIFVAYSASSVSEMPEDLKTYALTCVQTWQDFLHKDFPNEDRYGVARVLKFVIKDSIYYQQAIQFATGIDITFMSNHTGHDPKYSDIITDNYIRYNDDCFSVHFKFTKYMTLTRTGATVTDDIDATYFFVNIDDGTGQKHWCIADMIDTINN